MEEKFCIEGREREYVVISVRIRKSLWQELDEMSEKTGCSKSNIINQMIKYAVDNAKRKKILKKYLKNILMCVTMERTEQYARLFTYCKYFC